MIYVHFTTDMKLPWKVRDDAGTVIGEFATGPEATQFKLEWLEQHGREDRDAKQKTDQG